MPKKLGCTFYPLYCWNLRLWPCGDFFNVWRSNLMRNAFGYPLIASLPVTLLSHNTTSSWISFSYLVVQFIKYFSIMNKNKDYIFYIHECLHDLFCSRQMCLHVGICSTKTMWLQLRINTYFLFKITQEII